MLIAVLVVFGALNADPVPVKPFGHAPLYQVLLIPFFVGLIVGWALRSRIVFRIRTKHSSKASQTETQ